MLAIYQPGRRERAPFDPAAHALPEGALWLDLLEPTPDEVALVGRALGIEVPTREEMREIEASARVYEEHGALFLTATILVHAHEPPPGTSEVTFILKGERLVTLRYADPQPFRGVEARIERQRGTLTSAPAILFWLLDGLIGRIADLLERVALEIDGLSGEIFNAANAKPRGGRLDLLHAIERIGRSGDTAARARECLLTFGRILLSLSASETVPQPHRKEGRTRAKTLTRDVASLTDHAAFLSAKISLLLDATLGMVNIEQNAIIKIFSVVAVVFLPPTLIASIYGMNFTHMPELAWPAGYPLAVGLMVVSAIVPLLYFKRRGWL